MDEWIFSPDIFKIFLDVSPNYFLVVDERNTILYVNKKAKEILEKMKIDNNFPLNLPSSENEAVIETVISKDKKITIQWNRYRNFDGINNQICLWVGQDITEIREAKKSIDTLNYILTRVPGFVFWKDKNLKQMGCNDNFAKQVGLKSPSEIVGLTDYDLPWSKEQTEQFLKDDRKVIDTGQSILNLEERQRQLDGKDIWLLTSKVPLYEDGKVSGVLGIYLDITQLKEAKLTEEELKKTQYQLDGAKLISGSVAHEIRTPLATIKAGVQWIEHSLSKLIEVNREIAGKQLGVNAVLDQEIREIKEAVELINKKVDQSNTVINMLLTKLQSVNFEFSEFSEFSAGECVQAAIKEFILPDNMLNKINFNKEHDFQILGNRTLVMHVIMNLLKNAVFYILKAKKGEITVWLEHHGETNEIHFKDTGTGIPIQILPHIFNSFFTTESSTGTGIGLAFSKMVMESHRGEINCISQEGKYTEFILIFPQARQ